MTSREDRIRQRAHQLWLEAGQPEGQDKRHWEEAERLIDIEGGENGDTLQTQPATSAPVSQPALSSKPQKGKRGKSKVY